MTIAALRETFKVPAKIGGRILFTASNGAKFKGVIKGTNFSHDLIKVKMDGERNTRLLHPTAQVVYLTPKGDLMPGELERLTPTATEPMSEPGNERRMLKLFRALTMDQQVEFFAAIAADETLPAAARQIAANY